MARTLDEILAEISPSYKTSTTAINDRLSTLDSKLEADIASTDAKLKTAYSDILNSANSRGALWSGIPLAEQAEYAATEYAPAIANLKSTTQDAKLTLQEQLNQLSRDKLSQAQSLLENEKNYDLQLQQLEQEKKRQAAELALQKQQLELQKQQLAASRAAFGSARSASASSYLSGTGSTSSSSSTTSTKSSSPYYTNKNGSYAFYNSAGKAITAGQYASLTGQDIRDVLYDMGSNGSIGAAKLYNQLRTAKNNTELFNKLQQLSKKYSYVVNGYNVNGATVGMYIPSF